MRLIKNNDKFKTSPALHIALVLTDIRALCSEYKRYNPRTIDGFKIYKHLVKVNKTHLFNVTNFDPNLYEQCSQAIKFRSMKPAYLTFDFTERLETEQMLILDKFKLPIYPENEDEYEIYKIQNLNLNDIFNKNKNGDKNASINNSVIKWE